MSIEAEQQRILTECIEDITRQIKEALQKPDAKNWSGREIKRAIYLAARDKTARAPLTPHYQRKMEDTYYNRTK